MTKEEMDEKHRLHLQAQADKQEACPYCGCDDYKHKKALSFAADPAQIELGLVEDKRT